jgi:tRNA threonylcarbamoyladenosine dehydratase
MTDVFSRTELLIGKAALARLKASKVAIFGIGGVGSFVVEGLVRSGIGHFVLVDDDVVCSSNLNRQLIATCETLGQPKVEVARARILAINPEAEVEIHQVFYLPETAEGLVRPDMDYIVDAVDTVTAKIDLISRAKSMGIPVISCMGAGNKLDPTRFQVVDIYQTSVCPLSRIMRKALKKRGIESLKVVYSPEEPIKPPVVADQAADGSTVPVPGQENLGSRGRRRRHVPGSIAFVPSVAGLIMAAEVIKDLITVPDPGRA